MKLGIVLSAPDRPLANAEHHSCKDKQHFGFDFEWLLTMLKKSTWELSYSLDGAVHGGERMVEGVVRNARAGGRSVVEEGLPVVRVLNSPGYQVCGESHAWRKDTQTDRPACRDRLLHAG